MRYQTYSNKIGSTGETLFYDYNDYVTKFNYITFANLYALKLGFGIFWKKVEVTPVNIGKYSTRFSSNDFRVGLDIKVYGKNTKGEEYTYHRREPGGIASGQTKLYKWGRYPIQVSKARGMTREELDYHFRKAKPKGVK